MTIYPIIDGEADEIHDFPFSRLVTVLRQADQAGAYHIPAVPVCRILRCKKNIEFRAILLQNALYLCGISVCGGGMPASTGHPAALESRFQGTRYAVPIDGTAPQESAVNIAVQVEGFVLAVSLGNAEDEDGFAPNLDKTGLFKQLGYLASEFFDGEQGIIDACRARLSAGNAKLDPKLPADRLVGSWRLWVPAGFSKEAVR